MFINTAADGFQIFIDFFTGFFELLKNLFESIF